VNNITAQLSDLIGQTTTLCDESKVVIPQLEKDSDWFKVFLKTTGELSEFEKPFQAT